LFPADTLHAAWTIRIHESASLWVLCSWDLLFLWSSDVLIPFLGSYGSYDWWSWITASRMVLMGDTKGL
jgi:hypothetical protein